MFIRVTQSVTVLVWQTDSWLEDVVRYTYSHHGKIHAIKVLRQITSGEYSFKQESERLGKAPQPTLLWAKQQVEWLCENGDEVAIDPWGEPLKKVL